MSDLQSQGRFRLLLVDNASPFDATVRFFSRYISGGSKQREFLLGAVTSGKQRLFEFHDIPNGEEESSHNPWVTLHVQTLDNKEDQWTTTNSPTYITFTSSSLGQARYLVKGTKQEPELKFDGLVEDAIKTPMPPLQYHRQKTEQAENKGVPEPSSELKDKFRWMQCVIQNKTQFLIVHDPPAYFNSGRYDDPPKNVEPYDNMVFTVCNRDAAFTGATGGAAFRIILDGVAEYPFALGWTNPIVGAVTAGVTASSNAEDAYNISSEVGNAIKSTQEFSALDEDGKEVKFRFELTAAPGRKALYVVNQLRVR